MGQNLYLVIYLDSIGDENQKVGLRSKEETFVLYLDMPEEGFVSMLLPLQVHIFDFEKGRVEELAIDFDPSIGPWLLVKKVNKVCSGLANLAVGYFAELTDHPSSIPAGGLLLDAFLAILEQLDHVLVVTCQPQDHLSIALLRPTKP